MFVHSAALSIAVVLLCFAFMQGEPTGHHRTVLVVQEGLGKVTAFDSATLRMTAEIAVDPKPHEIAVSSDGRTAYVSNFGWLEVNHKVGIAGKTISVIDVDRGIEKQRFVLPAGKAAAPHGIKLRPPQEQELFTNAEEGDLMLVLSAASGQMLRSFPLPQNIHNFIFSDDGSMLFAFSTAGEVFRIRAQDGHVEAQRRVSSPRGLAWTADGSMLIVSGRGELEMLNPADLAVVRTLPNLPVHQIFYPASSPDGRFIFAPAVLDGIVLVLDAHTGQVTREIRTGSPLSVTIAPEGRTAWVSNVLVPDSMLPPDSAPRAGGVTELNLTTFEMKQVPGIVDANGLAVSAVPVSSAK